MVSGRLRLGFGILVISVPIVVLSFAACSLDEVGLATDGSVLDQLDVLLPDGTCTLCTSELGAGWRLALVGAADASCPTNHTSSIVFADAAVTPSACTCSCTSSTTNPCNDGLYALGYGSPSCNVGATGQLPANGGACTAVTGTLSDHYQVTFSPFTPQCTSKVVVDGGATAEGRLLCEPFTTCEEATCNGAPPDGFAACIEIAGDVPCPAGSFQNRTYVLTDLTYSCSNSCNCANIPLSCTGTFSYYADTQCDASLVSVAVGDGCKQNTNGGATGRSSRWDGVVADGGCAPTGSSQPVIQTSSARTLCCR